MRSQLASVGACNILIFQNSMLLVRHLADSLIRHKIVSHRGGEDFVIFALDKLLEDDLLLRRFVNVYVNISEKPAFPHKMKLGWPKDEYVIISIARVESCGYKLDAAVACALVP